MKSHAVVNQSIMLIINQYKDKVLDPTYFPSTPEETLHARITATYLLSNASPDIVCKASALSNKTSTNSSYLARLAALSAKSTFWEKLNILETDGKHFCNYFFSYQSISGKEEVQYHANYLTENGQCRFTNQTSVALTDKKLDSLNVTKGGFSFLAPAPEKQEINITIPSKILKSKL